MVNGGLIQHKPVLSAHKRSCHIHLKTFCCSTHGQHARLDPLVIHSFFTVMPTSRLKDEMEEVGWHESDRQLAPDDNSTTNATNTHVAHRQVDNHVRPYPANGMCHWENKAGRECSFGRRSSTSNSSPPHRYTDIIKWIPECALLLFRTLARKRTGCRLDFMYVHGSECACMWRKFV